MKTSPVNRLSDYRPPAFLIDHVDLTVELVAADMASETTITAAMVARRNPDPDAPGGPLMLDGSGLSLRHIVLNGENLPEDRYELTDTRLILHDPPNSFILETECRIRPGENKALEGLYRSGSMFCTQCEAEGFRKITWYPDRPDVMARFTCTIIGDKDACPVMLSNGNFIDSGNLPSNRHWVKWRDPFPKPSYLFALVAGNLVCVEDEFTTMSGRKVALQIYVEPENRNKCSWAMESLKKAMKWDEEVYGREYDLDRYMIVAVNDFNMGAMENKGLNVFNAKYVLAEYDSATDDDFWNIERVIGHEYFHNWTGNRITLRNWFQLALKEGLTVFRDQEFAMDLTSRAVKRISDVRVLRTHQFQEDAGPMAHPVRPGSYVKMDNFYTVTVYEKGAELIRMIHTLLGPEDFRNGMDLYFERHDGEAVTLEDFIAAMADASHRDLSRFMRWYSRPGTPELHMAREWDAHTGTFYLHFRQELPDLPAAEGNDDTRPLLIPVALGLLDKNGASLGVHPEETPRAVTLPLLIDLGEPPDSPGYNGLDDTGDPASASEGETTCILEVAAKEQTFTFKGLKEEPVPSVLRGFSAPVRLVSEISDEEKAFLFAHDPDEFNRWDAAQSLFSSMLLDLADQVRAGEEPDFKEMILPPFRQTLCHPDLDKAFIAQALLLPTERELAVRMSRRGPVDPDALHQAREMVRREIAIRLRKEFLTVFEDNQEMGRFEITRESVSRRKLKALCLSYMAALPGPHTTRFLLDRYTTANNMTDAVSALAALSHYPGKERNKAFSAFYRRWHADTVVLDKFFALQAMAQAGDTLERVRDLMDHEAFSMTNPNKVRALIGSFAMANPWRFHDPSGRGYEFLTDRVLELDEFNPQIASRMVQAMNQWKQYEPVRRDLMKGQLERITGEKAVSDNLREIVEKALV